MESVGTRSRNGLKTISPLVGVPNNVSTRDVGMSKYYSGTATFTSGTARVTATVAGALSAFQIGDIIEIFQLSSQSVRTGVYDVVGVDVSNGTYLTISPAASTAGAVSVLIRTL